MSPLILAAWLAVAGDMPPEAPKAPVDEVHEFSAIFFEGRKPSEWGQRLLRTDEACRALEEVAREIAKANGVTIVTRCTKIAPPSPVFKRERDT